MLNILDSKRNEKCIGFFILLKFKASKQNLVYYRLIFINLSLKLKLILFTKQLKERNLVHFTTYKNFKFDYGEPIDLYVRVLYLPIY